jgi:predicted DNA binding protein
VLRTAHRLGYFAVPREASTAEVAAALGLDDSTVAEHLQRAERNLLDRLLG